MGRFGNSIFVHFEATDWVERHLRKCRMYWMIYAFNKRMVVIVGSWRWRKMCASSWEEASKMWGSSSSRWLCDAFVNYAGEVVWRYSRVGRHAWIRPCWTATTTKIIIERSKDQISTKQVYWNIKMEGHKNRACITSRFGCVCVLNEVKCCLNGVASLDKTELRILTLQLKKRIVRGLKSCKAYWMLAELRLMCPKWLLLRNVIQITA